MFRSCLPPVGPHASQCGTSCTFLDHEGRGQSRGASLQSRRQGQSDAVVLSMKTLVA